MSVLQCFSLFCLSDLPHRLLAVISLRITWEKELPGLRKLFEPVAKAYGTYEAALTAYQKYMQYWVGRLPESDLSGRALELVQQEIERSLR